MTNARRAGRPINWSDLLPSEVLDEVAKRNYPGHGFYMNKRTQYDVLRDSRRLEIVVTVDRGI